MIHATLRFLAGLNKNNNKPWFDAHRNQYESAKEDLSLLVSNMIKSIALFDAPIGNLVAKECVFRINRDVRFSKDKSPYKNNLAAYFNKGGKKSNGAGYYLHIEPGKSFAAGGIWMPEPAVLSAIRQEIDYHFADWKKIITAPIFKKLFKQGINTNNALKRPPKGYDESNPAIDFIKMKSFVVTCPITDQELQDKNFIREITKIFRAVKPLIDFINQAIE